MDWRDLIAWHQHAEVLATRAQPGLLRLCDQDPARIYLSISLNAVNNVLGFYRLTTNPNADANSGGLTIGQQWEGSLNNRIFGGYINYTLGLVTGPQLPFTFDVGTGTGTFWNNATLLALDAQTGTGVPGLYDTPQLQPTMAPLRYEFWPDRHGILCQLAWYVWDDAGGAAFSVLTVRQERDPCEYIPGTTTPRRKQAQCDPSKSLRAAMRTWHGSNAFGRGRNLFGGSVGFQRAPNKPPVQPDQYQSGMD